MSMHTAPAQTQQTPSEAELLGTLVERCPQLHDPAVAARLLAAARMALRAFSSGEFENAALRREVVGQLSAAIARAEAGVPRA